MVIESNDGFLNRGVADFGDGVVTVNDGALLEVVSGASLTAEEVRIDAGGTVRGCGEFIVTRILNLGRFLADCGAPSVLEISGLLENEGLVRVSKGGGFSIGAVVNRGLFDAISAANSAEEVMNAGGGRKFDSERPGTPSVSVAGGTATTSVFALEAHVYKLEVSSSLAIGSWQDAGVAARTGTNGVIQFSLPIVSGEDQQFYRIKISDE